MLHPARDVAVKAPSLAQEERGCRAIKFMGSPFRAARRLALSASRAMLIPECGASLTSQRKQPKGTIQIGAAAVRARKRWDADVLLPFPVKLRIALSRGLLGSHMDREVGRESLSMQGMPFRGVHRQPPGLHAAVVHSVNALTILGSVAPAVKVEGTQAPEHLHVNTTGLGNPFSKCGDLPDQTWGGPLIYPCTPQTGASAPVQSLLAHTVSCVCGS